MRSLYLLVALLLSSPCWGKDSKPNIVAILCDDLGYGDIGCFGHPIIKTPHLDQLAKDGLKLTSFYCGQSVCSPSRAALLTGRNPNRFGINDWIPPHSGICLPKTEMAIPTLLKTIDYKTCHVGKWHLNSKMDGTEPTPGTHGFDHWFATQNNAAPTHENPTNFIRNGKSVGPLTGNSSTLIIDEAISWLKTIDKTPYYLNVWFHAPHEPVATPKEFTDRYADVADATKRTFFGSVTLVDHEIGRLLKTLADRGEAENTLVIFTSDNGPETLNRYKAANRSHGTPGALRGMKLHLTEGGNRVPGIIRWPMKIRPGQVTDTPAGFVDLLPTISTIAGVKAPTDRTLDGADVSQLLTQGTDVARSKPLYWQYDRAISDTKPNWTIAIRDGDWKLLSDSKRELFALYNVKTDISEKHDLSGQTEHAAQLQAMIKSLRDLYSDINKK